MVSFLLKRLTLSLNGVLVNALQRADGGSDEHGNTQTSGEGWHEKEKGQTVKTIKNVPFTQKPKWHFEDQKSW